MLRAGATSGTLADGVSQQRIVVLGWQHGSALKDDGWGGHSHAAGIENAGAVGREGRCIGSDGWAGDEGEGRHSCMNLCLFMQLVAMSCDRDAGVAFKETRWEIR